MNNINPPTAGRGAGSPSTTRVIALDDADEKTAVRAENLNLPVAPPSVSVRSQSGSNDWPRTTHSHPSQAHLDGTVIEATEPSITSLLPDNLFEIGLYLGHAGAGSYRDMSTAFSRMADFSLINQACSVVSRQLKRSPVWKREAAALCDRQIKTAVARNRDPQTRRSAITHIAERFQVVRLETKYDTHGQTKTALTDAFGDVMAGVLAATSWKRLELSLRHIGEPIHAGLRDLLAQLEAMQDAGHKNRQFVVDLQDNRLGSWLAEFCEVVLRNRPLADNSTVESPPASSGDKRTVEAFPAPRAENRRFFSLTLVTLNLGGNDLDDDAMIKIGRMLRENRSLRMLDLGRNFHNNRIAGVGARAVFDGFAEQGCLENLSLRGNKCLDDPQAIASLANLLVTTSTLEVLDLGSTGLQAAGLESLATALANNSTLRKLDISGNRLGADGLDILVGVFRAPVCKSGIESLKCNALGIDEEKLIGLSEWLSSNPPLRELALGTNRFSNNTALCLLHALATNFRLRSLNLSYAHFDEQGLTVLLESMQARTTPLRLTLGYHKVSWSRDEQALARLRSMGLTIAWNAND